MTTIVVAGVTSSIAVSAVVTIRRIIVMLMRLAKMRQTAVKQSSEKIT